MEFIVQEEAIKVLNSVLSLAFALRKTVKLCGIWRQFYLSSLEGQI
jgi:hypothetical protein